MRFCFVFLVLFSVSAQASYIGLKDPRTPTPSKRAMQLYNATGLVLSHTPALKGTRRHTAFICEHPKLMCASYHSICDSINPDPKPDREFTDFVPHWPAKSTEAISVDLNKSWFGKRDANGNKIYGVCPVGDKVDMNRPVLLRLKNSVTKKHPHIKPVKLMALDLKKLRRPAWLSDVRSPEIENYYKSLNKNAIAIGYHNEIEIDSVPVHLKRDRNVKYVQETGFKLVTQTNKHIYNFDEYVNNAASLVTTGYFIDESSGSPQGQCLDNGQCHVYAIHVGQLVDSSTNCLAYQKLTESSSKCLNMSHAITPSFKRAVVDEAQKINRGY